MSVYTFGTLVSLAVVQKDIAFICFVFTAVVRRKRRVDGGPTVFLFAGFPSPASKSGYCQDL